MTNEIAMTKAEFRAYEEGPDGTCKGCYEPNAFCQCEPCEICYRHHDPNLGCNFRKTIMTTTITPTITRANVLKTRECASVGEGPRRGRIR